MTTDVLSKLAPHNGGAFPTHSDIHTEGGYQVRTDATDRDSIPTANRKEGMWVRLISDGLVYSLGSGLTNGDWTVVTFGGTTPAAVFDAGTASENIKSNRATAGSPIDNTKDGIVNLGSATTLTNGAQGNYSTIGGGENNNATADYSTVCGGQNQTASGLYSFIGGGSLNTPQGNLGVICGGDTNNIDAGATNAAILGGSNNSVGGNNSSTLGGGNNIVNSGADFAVVHGYKGSADKIGHYVHSSGSALGATGQSQFTRVVYSIFVATASSGNFTEGVGGTQQFIVEGSRNYALKVTMIAANQAGAGTTMYVRNYMLAVDPSVVLTLTDFPAADIAIGATTDLVLTTDASVPGVLSFILTNNGANGALATLTIESTEVQFS